METPSPSSELRLVKHLKARGIASSFVEVTETSRTGVAIKGKRFQIAKRTMPDVPERLLEVISLHLLRADINSDDRTLLLLTVPRLPKGSPNWLLPLVTYQQARKSSAPWAVLSTSGGCLLYLPSIGKAAIYVDDHEERSRSDHVARAESREPTSDVELAVLKYVLLSASALTTDQRKVRNAVAYAGPAPNTIQELARWLNVSRAAVYNAVGDFVHRGWLKSQRGGIPSLVSGTAVINWWCDRSRHRNLRTIPVAPLYRAVSSKRSHLMEFLAGLEKPRGASWAVTGWTALALHRKLAIAEAKGKPVTLAVAGSMRAFMSAHELREVPAGNEILQLQACSHPITAFSWCSDFDGMLVVDLWEAVLAVIADPQRGQEQAAAIADDLLLRHA